MDSQQHPNDPRQQQSQQPQPQQSQQQHENYGGQGPNTPNIPPFRYSIDSDIVRMQNSVSNSARPLMRPPHFTLPSSGPPTSVNPSHLNPQHQFQQLQLRSPLPPPSQSLPPPQQPRHSTSPQHRLTTIPTHASSFNVPTSIRPGDIHSVRPSAPFPLRQPAVPAEMDLRTTSQLSGGQYVPRYSAVAAPPVAARQQGAIAPPSFSHFQPQNLPQHTFSSQQQQQPSVPPKDKPSNFITGGMVGYRRGSVATSQQQQQPQQPFPTNYFPCPQQEFSPSVVPFEGTYVSRSPTSLSTPLPNSTATLQPTFSNNPTSASWLSFTTHQQQALLATAHRVEGAFEDREFTYTEGLLRGLTCSDRMPDVQEKLTSLLFSLTGSEPQLGAWTSECWRALVDPEMQAVMNGRLSRQRSEFHGELWIKKYLQPAYLRHFHCLRMFSPEHVVASSSFPLNARRVKEAAVAPQFVKMLPSLGFRKSTANTFHVSALLFHLNTGSSDDRLLISVQRYFKESSMSEDLFPGKLVVEVIGRVEEDSMLEPLSRRILELCRHLQPFVQFNKF